MLRHEVLEDTPRSVRVGKRGGAGSAYVELPEDWRILEIRPPEDAMGVAAKTPLADGDVLVVLGPAPASREG